jgi:hypothetical protein
MLIQEHPQNEVTSIKKEIKIDLVKFLPRFCLALLIIAIVGNSPARKPITKKIKFTPKFSLKGDKKSIPSLRDSSRSCDQM